MTVQQISEDTTASTWYATISLACDSVMKALQTASSVINHRDVSNEQHLQLTNTIHLLNSLAFEYGERCKADYIAQKLVQK